MKRNIFSFASKLEIRSRFLKCNEYGNIKFVKTFTTENRRPTDISLQSFLESPTNFPSVNGLKANREIFFVGEQHRLYEITDELKKIFRITTIHGILTAACYFTCPPFFSAIMMGSFSVPLYYTIKIYRMNNSIKLLASKLIWKMELSEDKKTVKFHTMLSSSTPTVTDVKNIGYLKYLDRDLKEPEEERDAANDASVAIKVSSFDEKNNENIGLYFLKIYFDNNGTVVPNAALLKAVLHGKDEEVKKFELTNLEKNNEIEEFVKKKAEK